MVQAINYQSGLAADGHRFVLMFNLFFNQQLGIIMNNEIDAGNFTTDSINLPLLPNTFLFSFNRRQPATAWQLLRAGFPHLFHRPRSAGAPLDHGVRELYFSRNFRRRL